MSFPDRISPWNINERNYMEKIDFKESKARLCFFYYYFVRHVVCPKFFILYYLTIIIELLFHGFFYSMYKFLFWN